MRFPKRDKGVAILQAAAKACETHSANADVALKLWAGATCTVANADSTKRPNLASMLEAAERLRFWSVFNPAPPAKIEMTRAEYEKLMADPQIKVMKSKVPVPFGDLSGVVIVIKEEKPEP